MLQSKLCLLFTLVLSSGCAGEKKKSNRSDANHFALSGLEAVILDDQGLELTPSSLKGSGTFVFIRPLREIASAQTFIMTLMIEDGGSADFRSYGFANLNSALSLRFAKSGNQYTVEYGNGLTRNDPAPLTADGNQPLIVTIDINNTLAPAGAAVYAGEQTARQEQTLLFQSPDQQDIKFYGSGSYFGFVVNASTVSAFALAK